MIVAEINNGGDLVERLLRGIDKNVVIKTVHATRGKMIRAEPVSALYEQKKVFHCGIFNTLEEQMCSFNGDIGKRSPDRLDALVWALTQLSASSGKPLWRVS
jgi:phage terminase large subunit-like protein